jgi:hypothetical protein
MSCYLSPDLRVRIEQMGGKFAPRPLPLENGFSADKTYTPVGMFCPSESGEAYLILTNDRDELWFISNRHVRVVAEANQARTGFRRTTEHVPATPAILNSPS